MMKWIFQPIVAIAVAGLSTACGGSKGKSEVIPLPIEASSRLADARVFFAHQSVGENIVDGLKALGSSSDAQPLKIVELQAVGNEEGPLFIHARLGQNGDPKSKTDAFVAALDAGLGASVDIAFQKYCFADFDTHTDVNAVFSYYRLATERVQKKFPALVLLHVTAPLMSVQSGPRAFVKKIIGRPPDYYLDNTVREEFNELMRREYGSSGHLFDLAAIEASRPGASAEPIFFQGRKLYSLLPEYTTDGGHLNAATQQRVAAALLSFMAPLVPKKRIEPFRSADLRIR
jgi:hypothetical protein